MSHHPTGTLLHQRYRLLSCLGTGSFATVYLARDSRRRGDFVALKQIDTEGYTEEEYGELNAHFLQEAAFLMQLDHPGLPRMVEFFAEGRSYYLAMEWVAGKTLSEMVRREGPRRQEEAVEIGLQLCEVLSYLHSREPYPVILGDLKPSNVMVGYDGRLKVIDFGVARYLAPGATRRKFSMVSPGFSPPEQYSRFEVDHRGDIYSLGATLYWALTQAELDRYRFKIPPVRRLRPDLSETLEAVLGVCLQPDPTCRYACAAAVAEELEKVRQELGTRRRKESAADILAALYRRKKKPGG